MINMESVRHQFHNAVESLAKVIPLEGLKSQAMNVMNIVRERLDVIIEKFGKINPIELLKTQLASEHHPYGLLLNMSPMLAGPTGGIDASGMSVVSSASASLQGSLGSNEDPATGSLKNLSIATFSGLSSSAHSPQASLLSTGAALSSMYTEVGDRKVQSGEPILGALSSILGLAAGSEPAIGQVVQQSFAVGNTMEAGAMIAPMLLSAKKEEALEIGRERVEVKPNKIRVGAVVVDGFIYRGRKPYVIEGKGLDDKLIVRPGNKVLALHVNEPNKNYTGLGPVERVKAIRHDFEELTKLLDDPRGVRLSEEQIKQVEAFRDAPIVGVSHLVRLIASKGLPTWTIDILPKVLRQFHRVDSQLVSRQFGGKREVKESDIGVMVLSPKMRSRVYA